MFLLVIESTRIYNEYKRTNGFRCSKLKEINSIIDVEPVVTEELLQLSKWITNKTLCYEIDALQVMLPAALRAHIKKIFSLLEPTE